MQQSFAWLVASLAASSDLREKLPYDLPPHRRDTLSLSHCFWVLWQFCVTAPLNCRTLQIHGLAWRIGLALTVIHKNITLARGNHPNFEKKRSENLGWNFGVQPIPRVAPRVAPRIGFSHKLGRECHSENCSEHTLEFRELLREWPFHSESIFFKIGVVPRLLNYIQNKIFCKLFLLSGYNCHHRNNILKRNYFCMCLCFPWCKSINYNYRNNCLENYLELLPNYNYNCRNYSLASYLRNNFVENGAFVEWIRLTKANFAAERHWSHPKMGCCTMDIQRVPDYASDCPPASFRVIWQFSDILVLFSLWRWHRECPTHM